MKVLVHFQPTKQNDNFEGARLRKTIKSALEIKNIPYTDTVLDDFDIAHFVCIEDESVIDELKERNIPIVVSALYCESDSSVSFLEYKNKDGYRSYNLKAKAIKFLEKADLILVPNENAKTLLENSGITSLIKACPYGVNFSRFDFSRDDEKEIFYRYFSCPKDKNVALALGDASLEGFGSILKSAKECPDTMFYYLYKKEKKVKLSKKHKKQLKELPVNLTLTNVVPDDVYRSILLNADLYLYTGYKPAGIISISEAMAAKCQLIVRDQYLLRDLVIDQKTAYVASYSETLVSLIKEYLNKELKPTIDNAYKEAFKNNIDVFGDTLLKSYQALVK